MACPTLIDSIDVEEDTVIVTYFEYEENCLQDIAEIQDIHQPNEHVMTLSQLRLLDSMS